MDVIGCRGRAVARDHRPSAQAVDPRTRDLLRDDLPQRIFSDWSSCGVARLDG